MTQTAPPNAPFGDAASKTPTGAQPRPADVASTSLPHAATDQISIDSVSFRDGKIVAWLVNNTSSTVTVSTFNLKLLLQSARLKDADGNQFELRPPPVPQGNWCPSVSALEAGTTLAPKQRTRVEVVQFSFYKWNRIGQDGTGRPIETDQLPVSADWAISGYVEKPLDFAPTEGPRWFHASGSGTTVFRVGSAG